MSAASQVSVRNTELELRLPPGPGANLLMSVLRQRKWVDPIAHFEYLAKSFGDIAHYRLGRRHIVFLNHPELLREVFVVQHANFIKERTQQRARLLLGEGMITADGARHREQRQTSAPVFYRQKIPLHAQEMVLRAAERSNTWQAGERRDLHTEMMTLGLGIIGATLFRTDLGDEVQALNAAMGEIMDVYNALVLLPGVRWLLKIPGTPLRKFVSARAQLHAAVDKLIAEHRRRGADDAGVDLLSTLLQAQPQFGWSDEHVRDQVVTVILAGYETTAIALTWTWYLLSQNAEAEAKFHAELDAVLGGRRAAYEDLPRLRYTEMVLAEALRLYPPAWAMGRLSLEAFEVGGYRLPKETTVIASQYILHRDARFWPEPLKFDPERHTPEAKAARIRGAYFPFGMGPRQCIGESLAWMEGMLVLATLGQRWRMRHDARHMVHAEPLFTLRPKGGMPMWLDAR